MGDWDPVATTPAQPAASAGGWEPVSTTPVDPWAPVSTTPSGQTPSERVAAGHGGAQQTGIFGLKKLEPSEAESYAGRTGDIWNDIKAKFYEGVEEFKQVPGSIVNREAPDYSTFGGQFKEIMKGMPFVGGFMDPTAGHLLKGFFDIVGSPVMGPVRSMASRPLEENYGIPHQITELPAELISPLPVQKAVTGTVRAAAPAVTAGVKWLEKAVSPASVDDAARLASTLIRGEGGKAARETMKTEAALRTEFDVTNPAATFVDKHWAKVNSMDDAAKADMIAYIEGRSSGTALADPELRPIVDTMRDAFKRRQGELSQMPSTSQMSFVEDYFPHMWEDPAAARQFLAGWSGKQGGGGFTKGRSIPTVADGIAAGLTPKHGNPLDAALEYVANADKFIAGNKVVEQGVASGHIRYFPQGASQTGPRGTSPIPADWVKLEGRLGTRGGQEAWAPEGFARVYNRFVDQGIHGWAGPQGGQAYDVVRRASNAVTAMELGLSGFHAVTMANEAGISSLARGIERIVGGARGGDLTQVMKGLKNVAESPVAFVTSAMRGKKLEQVYLGKTPGTADMREAADLLTAAGGRGSGFKHAPDYEFSPMNSFWTSLRRGALRMEMDADKALVQQAQGAGEKTIAGLRVGFRNMGRILQTVAKPLFENYIPKLKNGAFYDTMSAWLERNPGATQEQRVKQAKTIWDSIDNRFGEMVQDNIFWGKTSKQVSQLAMRSYSWNLGTVREIGGGMSDIARGVAGKVTGRDLGGGWTPRAAYTIAMPIWVGAMNAAYQYLKTGKGPESVHDLVAGQTGGEAPGATVPSTKPFGRSSQSVVPERVMIPGYQKDVLGWYEDWRQEAGNKLSGGLSTAAELWRGKDWKGDPIANPEASAPEWLKQYFEHVGSKFIPIAVKEMWKGPKTDSNIGVAERGMGIKPAGTALSDPEGHELAKERRGSAAWKRKEAIERKQRGQYPTDD